MSVVQRIVARNNPRRESIYGKTNDRLECKSEMIECLQLQIPMENPYCGCDDRVLTAANPYGHSLLRL